MEEKEIEKEFEKLIAGMQKESGSLQALKAEEAPKVQQKKQENKSPQPQRRFEESSSSIVGFSVVGLLFLLGYSYVELLGWMYMTMGNVKISLILMIVFAVVLSVTSFMLPRIWSSNRAFISKRRNTYMILTGAVFIVAMLLSFIGVSHFAKIYNDKEEITRLYDGGVMEARGLYPEYNRYVDNRVNAYSHVLDNAIAVKTSRYATYNDCVGRFPGATDQQRKQNLIKSLKRTLQPTNDNLQENFNKWLNGTGEANLWNMSFVKNVSVLDYKITTCIQNLTDMSCNFYHPGEEKAPFVYPQYSSNSKLQELMSTTGFYVSWKSLLLLILTAFTLIMPTLRDGLRSRKDI